MRREQIANNVFEEIRDKPFRVALSADRPANNCYFKCMELSQKLITLGYQVRGRLGEINWNNLSFIPNEILELFPQDQIDTHFYLEIFLNEEWFILDPTWNKSFAQKFNQPYSVFGQKNKSCFQIVRLYNNEEQSDYAWTWLNDQTVIAEYTSKTGEFFKALNNWLEANNSK